MQNFLFQSSSRIRIGCSRWKLTYTFAIVSDFKQLNMLPLIKKNTYGIVTYRIYSVGNIHQFTCRYGLTSEIEVQYAVLLTDIVGRGK